MYRARLLQLIDDFFHLAELPHVEVQLTQFGVRLEPEPIVPCVLKEAIR